jgi:hypothetical protein
MATEQSHPEPQEMNGMPQGTLCWYAVYASPKNRTSCCSSTGIRRLKNTHTYTRKSTVVNPSVMRSQTPATESMHMQYTA